MNRILFVDDEPRLLAGLRRMLHGCRREWEAEFAESGEEALARLAADSFDVIVTDMCMPGMSGRELLGEVSKRHPTVVRVVLSGQYDRLSVLEAVGCAHQFLTKPCDPNTLKSTLSRACRLRNRPLDDLHKSLVSRVESIPSQPAAYDALAAELAAAQPSLPRLGRIIAGDVGMTAKVLQLVNSGFLGTPQRVTDPRRAVALLGVDNLQAIVASSQVFRPWSDDECLPADCLATWTEHSLTVAAMAREITRNESEHALLVSDAWLAGLLHDIGIFLLARHLPQRYLEILAAARWRRVSLWEEERQDVGVTHADLGGYLAALWGLPEAIVDAITYHHSPGLFSQRGFHLLTAVHVANSLADEQILSLLGTASPVDMAYLDGGLGHRIDAWRRSCRPIRRNQSTHSTSSPTLVEG